MLSLDIQVEIMKKLPVKSLIHFRSVCKAWKSLIASSHFIAGYNDRRDLPQHLLVRYGVGRYWEENEVKYGCFVDDDSFPQQKFVPSIPPLVKVTRIIGSSHGLLCLSSYFPGRCPTIKTQMVALWNPSIRKSIVVDVPNPVHNPLNYVLGFWVCPRTMDPKLVKINREMKSITGIPFQVMIFTLSSGEWTTLSCTNHLPHKSIEFTWSHTVIDQFIYWLAYGMTVEDGTFRFHKLIISFDLSTPEFREIDLPDSLAKMGEPDLSVSRVRESLAVVEYSLVFEDFTCKEVCCVWMMEHGYFTKLFTINLPNASVLQILGFRKSGEPIVETQDNDDKDYDSAPVVVYEPCSKHIKDLGICGNNYSFFGSFYTESLLLLDHDDGQIVRCGVVKQ